MEQNNSNRWLIAAAAVVMQVALGAVYAWSVFRTPLMKDFGWTISQVTFTFELAILSLGFAAFVGGLWMAKAGPRVVGVAGGVLYGLGFFLASFSASDFIGRRWVFLALFLLRAVIFFLMPRIHTFAALAVASFIIVLAMAEALARCRRSPPTTSAPRTWAPSTV